MTTDGPQNHDGPVAPTGQAANDGTSGEKPTAPDGEAQAQTPPGPEASHDTQAQHATQEPHDAPDPIGELREKITAATEGFLKARLGLETGPDGGLQLPDRGVFENVGQRADQFLRGFLKGIVERTPEEREAEAGLRDKADVPSATEVVGRMLSKASGAVTNSFHQYLAQHVAPSTAGEKPVVVDGRFLLQHGAPLLAGFVQALGKQFADKADGPAQNTGEPAPEATAEAAPPAEAPSPRVDYKVDLPSLFTSLFVRPRDPEDPKDTQGGGS